MICYRAEMTGRGNQYLEWGDTTEKEKQKNNNLYMTFVFKLDS